MKRKVWKYFTANNTHVYIDVLQKLVVRYNNIYHHSIKITPREASQSKNHACTLKSLYPNTSTVKRGKAKFKAGDIVRIGKKKKTFERGFTTNWTEELFSIVKAQPTNPWTYKINQKIMKKCKGLPIKKN